MKSTNNLARQQHEVQKKKFNQDIKDLSAEQKKVIEFRVQNEEVDFSLFNYIMTVHDFTDVKDLNEAVMKMYRYMFTHTMVLQRQNEKLKDYLCALRSEVKDADRLRNVDEVLIQESPFLLAQRFLLQLQERAKNRSKSGIVSYTPEEAKDLGIKL